MVDKKIRSSVQVTGGNIDIVRDRKLEPSMFGSVEEEFSHPHNKPDIVCIDRDKREVIITEVSVPFDAHLDYCYKSKFDKYFPLSREINEMGYRTEIIVLIIGALGNVHKRFVSGLKKNGISQTEAKYLAKYCSISAIIGSYKVWKMRCKNID